MYIVAYHGYNCRKRISGHFDIFTPTESSLLHLACNDALNFVAL